MNKSKTNCERPETSNSNQNKGHKVKKKVKEMFVSILHKVNELSIAGVHEHLVLEYSKALKLNISSFGILYNCNLN